MRVTRQKAAENRERIIEAAGALLRANGFSGIGVADIMKAANLTHGGFYGHFESKDDLVAQACRKVTAEAAGNWEKTAAKSPEDPYAALLTHYLRPRHRDEPGQGCCFAALGADAARSSAVVRDAFADGLEPLIDLLAKSAPGKTKAERRRKGVAAMAGLVGALLLSRAIGTEDNKEFSDEILEATRRELLDAGKR
ncbi:MAG TPA: TetR/AcrR family transcriptional regulator [Xanthobacteraceae bacterium]|jgi:TetR/AcrR family transcriptional repressor of nem operon|nr:TetR/AcrR family transcriptional regulator [Xanthobacteraceae bacterium]